VRLRRWIWRTAILPITVPRHRAWSWKSWMQRKSVWLCCISAGMRLRLCCAGCMPVSWMALDKNSPNRLLNPRPFIPRPWPSIRAIRTIYLMMWWWNGCISRSRRKPLRKCWTNTRFPFRSTASGRPSPMPKLPRKPPIRNTRTTCAAMHRTSALPMSIWVKAVQKPSSRQMLMPFVC